MCQRGKTERDNLYLLYQRTSDFTKTYTMMIVNPAINNVVPIPIQKMLSVRFSAP